MDISIDQIKASIGGLVYLTCDVERSLSRALTSLDQEIPHRVSQRLAKWEKTVRLEDCPIHAEACTRLAEWLRQALCVRNRICHGLVSYSADWYGVEAHLAVETPHGPQRLTWSCIQDLCGHLSKAGQALADLTEARCDPSAADRKAQPWRAFPHMP